MRISEVQEAVAKYFSMERRLLLVKSRKRSFVRPRQIGMYLTRELTGKSYPEIARAFGKQDHTTVIHAVRHIEALRQCNEDVAEAVDEIRRRIINGEVILRSAA